MKKGGVVMERSWKGSSNGGRSGRWDVKHWRRKLFSVFVRNLSPILTWAYLKEIFSRFGGVVVDIYIPRFQRKQEVRFTFIRYRYEMEQKICYAAANAIKGAFEEYGNVVDVFIPRKVQQDPKREEFERRSYKEVMVGKGVMEKKQWKAKLNEKENLEKSLQGMVDQKMAPKLRKITVEQEQRNGYQNGRINVEKMNAHERANLVKLGTEHRLKSKDNILVFKDKIPVADMEWMQRSIMGKLHRHVFPKIVQEELQHEGIRVQVRPVGGLRVVLVFTDEEDKEKILKDHKEGLNEWFDYLYPCSKKNELCSSKVWVDRQTELKLRFDQALIQVETTNKANIPPVTKIWSCEKLWELPVHIVEAPDIEKMVLTKVEKTKKGEDSGAVLVEREMMGMDLDMAGTKGPRGEEIEKVKGSSYSIGSLVCKMGQKDSNWLEYESWEGRSNSEGGLWTDSGLDPKRRVGESSTNLSSGDITQKIKVDIGPKRVNKGDENSSSLEAISRQGTKGIGRRIRE
ncbi:Uncharacterized protein TCM_036328 [Theobroma cacao]|uniref:RRM domain-containing protein n=1 Tax=Theobroma cacao TaxID=3641 RepID=A0A061FJF5_THECC|nr:Uncharacterized protein TCM_036328 [Theobroma cacao]